MRRAAGSRPACRDHGRAGIAPLEDARLRVEPQPPFDPFGLGRVAGIAFFDEDRSDLPLEERDPIGIVRLRRHRREEHGDQADRDAPRPGVLHAETPRRDTDQAATPLLMATALDSRPKSWHDRPPYVQNSAAAGLSTPRRGSPSPHRRVTIEPVLAGPVFSFQANEVMTPATSRNDRRWRGGRAGRSVRLPVHRLVPMILALFGCGWPARVLAASPGQDGDAFFERSIRPLLVERCYETKWLPASRSKCRSRGKMSRSLANSLVGAAERCSPLGRSRIVSRPLAGQCCSRRREWR
jgi:hypothetical protein